MEGERDKEIEGFVSRKAERGASERDEGDEGGGKRRRTQIAEGASANARPPFTSIDREGWGSMAERPRIRLPELGGVPRGREGTGQSANARWHRRRGGLPPEVGVRAR